MAVRRACLAVGGVAVSATAWAAAGDIVAGRHDLAADWALVTLAALLCACALMGRLMRAGAPPR